MTFENSRHSVRPKSLVDPRTLTVDEIHFRLTGSHIYNFTPIDSEPKLRDAIANTSWTELARFGREFQRLTMGMPNAKAVLVRIALDDKEPIHTHSHAMCALSKIGDGEAIEALKGVIYNPNFPDAVRYRAAQWVACVGSTDAALALERIIFDADAPLTAKRGAVYGMNSWSKSAETDRVLDRIRSDEDLFAKVRDCFEK